MFNFHYMCDNDSILVRKETSWFGYFPESLGTVTSRIKGCMRRKKLGNMKSLLTSNSQYEALRFSMKHYDLLGWLDSSLS
ncbi:hypothetical protein L2E82_47158 [Cichorium intybus]|uniref:Uncharacterized protein n=1 Tax=Cichorium intybus TaxID=13427 RepID=A0ACB8YUK2_CICIN|nr:hypothetical protein L2E82_47158 [Cichorium intybus]